MEQYDTALKIGQGHGLTRRILKGDQRQFAWCMPAHEALPPYVHRNINYATKKAFRGIITLIKKQGCRNGDHTDRSEEHTSELQSLMRLSYAVFCLKKQTQ